MAEAAVQLDLYAGHGGGRVAVAHAGGRRIVARATPAFEAALGAFLELLTALPEADQDAAITGADAVFAAVGERAARPTLSAAGDTTFTVDATPELTAIVAELTRGRADA